MWFLLVTSKVENTTMNVIHCEKSNLRPFSEYLRSEVRPSMVIFYVHSMTQWYDLAK